MTHGQQEERSKFANRPETIEKRAIRAEVRRLAAGVVARQLATLRRLLATRTNIRAIPLVDSSGGVCYVAITPTDERCWKMGVEWLLEEVERIHGEVALVIIKLHALDNLSWESIGYKLHMQPMRARTLFFSAATDLICYEKFYQDLQRDEAA